MGWKSVLLVARVHLAIREVDVELREQGPDVRERVRELVAGLRDITSFIRCRAAAGLDASLLSAGRCCEKDPRKQQRRRHNWPPSGSCASNSPVFFCFHLNYFSAPRDDFADAGCGAFYGGAFA